MFFTSASMKSVERLIVKPDDERPDERTIGRPESTERDRREDQQQDSEAEVPLHLVEPEEDAAQRGERRTRHPHQRDHPLDVDAGRLGEFPVVGHCSHRLAHTSQLEVARDADEDDDRQTHRDHVLRREVDRTDA